VIIWINGGFGAGKSTLAAELVRWLPDALLFDPASRARILRG
jgi:hypothetical protein